MNTTIARCITPARRRRTRTGKAAWALPFACLFMVSAPALADCNARIEKLRELQAKTPYLDPQRPDLERLRQVAQRMAADGREALCRELVSELEDVVQEHRRHASNLEQIEKYAAPVDIGSWSSQLDTARLNGMSVRNRVGEELGVVQGVILDGGKAQALIVEHGGFLGIGESRVRVPWKAVQITRDGSAIVLDMSAGDLQQLSEADGSASP